MLDPASLWDTERKGSEGTLSWISGKYDVSSTRLSAHRLFSRDIALPLPP